MKNLALSRTLRAFTLIELLVAVGVTALIVVMLGQIFSTAAAMWRVGSQRIDAFRDGRAALQLMAADLSRANINGDARMLTLTQFSSDGSYATEADAISPMKNSGKSDLCAVQYYLVWDGTSNTYSLMRRTKESDAMSNATNGYLKNSPPNFTAIYDKTSGTEETIATPIWDLQFRPGETDTVLAPSTDTAAKWKWIEIKFKSMSINSASKLKSLAGIDQTTWANPTSPAYKTLILPSEQQFVTRVSIEQNK